MIAKDEAGLIASAVGSCAGVYEELVVVDTGSTDGTPDVARGLGARVYAHAWEDSFSAARNFALERVRTKWAVMIDCDETLAAGAAEQVRRALETRPDAHGFVCAVRVHVGAESVTTQEVRIGRADLDYRFRERVHETLYRTGPEKAFGPVAGCGVVIDARGHVIRPPAGKMPFYNRLLELQIRDRPGDSYSMISLMQNLRAMGDGRWREWRSRALSAMDLRAARPPHPLAAVLLELELRTDDGASDPALPRAEAERVAERWFPRSLPVLLARAVYWSKSGRKDLSGAIARHAIKLWNAEAHERTVGFDPARARQELEALAGAGNNGGVGPLQGA